MPHIWIFKKCLFYYLVCILGSDSSAVAPSEQQNKYGATVAHDLIRRSGSDGSHSSNLTLATVTTEDEQYYRGYCSTRLILLFGGATVEEPDPHYGKKAMKRETWYNKLLPPSQNITICWLLLITFDHSSYLKNLWKYKNNYDILKIYTMIKHVITK